MSIENMTKICLKKDEIDKDLIVYDFKMTNDVVKSKINLSMNMFRFLQVGKKQVHFFDASVIVSKKQPLKTYLESVQLIFQNKTNLSKRLYSSVFNAKLGSNEIP